MNFCKKFSGKTDDSIKIGVIVVAKDMKASFLESWRLYKRTGMTALITSIDVLLSKNQALFEYCTLVSKLKHC